jgi:hypothetical protein
VTIESPELLASVLNGQHGTDCAINPDGSPAGAVIRVLFAAPFLGQDAGTGVFQNTAPQAYARETDVASLTPEQTVLRIDGRDYVASRAEPIAGGSWRLLVLREVVN